MSLRPVWVGDRGIWIVREPGANVIRTGLGKRACPVWVGECAWGRDKNVPQLPVSLHGLTARNKVPARILVSSSRDAQ